MHFQFRSLFPLPPPLADFFIVWPVISACFSRLFLKGFFSANILAFYSFTGFSALQSILCLLPTFTFSPLANLSYSLPHFFSLFIQPVFSTYFFSQFSATFSNLWVSSLTSLYQTLHLLPPPLVFQPFSQLFPFFLHSVPLSWEFFHIFGHIFSGNFSAIWLVSLTHLLQSLSSM